MIDARKGVLDPPRNLHRITVAFALDLNVHPALSVHVHPRGIVVVGKAHRGHIFKAHTLRAVCLARAAGNSYGFYHDALDLLKARKFLPGKDLIIPLAPEEASPGTENILPLERSGNITQGKVKGRKTVF